MRFPEQADTWEAYLFYLREHAAADGRLPPYFDVLIREVFGPILS
jgi:hypothetical protein